MENDSIVTLIQSVEYLKGLHFVFTSTFKCIGITHLEPLDNVLVPTYVYFSRKMRSGLKWDVSMGIKKE